MKPDDFKLLPLVSEKSTKHKEGGEYTFLVSPLARKDQIRTAVEKLFNVTVKGVRTGKVRGKTKRIGRSIVKKSDFKKVHVKLGEKDKIDLFEGEGKAEKPKRKKKKEKETK
ncbi:MAG: 50S ribosomal protein L23 [Candidatus Blackburnbacteria bacterium]|nr:50S ribosomal protein L23 [Candidatus Blackburnbacteria bacterium]